MAGRARRGAPRAPLGAPGGWPPPAPSGGAPGAPRRALGAPPGEPGGWVPAPPGALEAVLETGAGRLWGGAERVEWRLRVDRTGAPTLVERVTFRSGRVLMWRTDEEP